MAAQQNSPFARVSNGYDPNQVAAFAAEALSWRKELATLRSEVANAGRLVQRYESVIGSIEDAELEATAVVEDAERRAADIIATAEAHADEIIRAAETEAADTEAADTEASHTEVAEIEVAVIESVETETAEITTGAHQREPAEAIEEPAVQDGDAWLDPEQIPDDTLDPVEQIFEALDEVEEVDPEAERERRIAAAAANLWKRRGVLSPSE